MKTPEKSLWRSLNQPSLVAISLPCASGAPRHATSRTDTGTPRMCGSASAALRYPAPMHRQTPPSLRSWQRYAWASNWLSDEEMERSVLSCSAARVNLARSMRWSYRHQSDVVQSIGSRQDRLTWLGWQGIALKRDLVFHRLRCVLGNHWYGMILRKPQRIAANEGHGRTAEPSFCSNRLLAATNLPRRYALHAARQNRLCACLAGKCSGRTCVAGDDQHATIGCLGAMHNLN
ncbi:hypothetical protein QE408_002370 [Agrobacterium larrymoorei]|uniref:Uncharacterized protein n=1 Tax=Agrobacterium larrymoorei TaxID=160699 RepID=A0ABU0UJW1_9HYPH|nr:hypothetical protein [Agrobacterium larrymoorei]